MWYWIEVYVLVIAGVIIPVLVLYVFGLVCIVAVASLRIMLRALKSAFARRLTAPATDSTLGSRKAA